VYAAVIVESTYGTSRHGPREVRERAFLDKVVATVKQGGRVLIPIVAIGRAQVRSVCFVVVVWGRGLRGTSHRICSCLVLSSEGSGYSQGGGPRAHTHCGHWQGTGTAQAAGVGFPWCGVALGGGRRHSGDTVLVLGPLQNYSKGVVLPFINGCIAKKGATVKGAVVCSYPSWPLAGTWTMSGGVERGVVVGQGGGGGWECGCFSPSLPL
jgi:hypothetical protein